MSSNHVAAQFPFILHASSVSLASLSLIFWNNYFFISYDTMFFILCLMILWFFSLRNISVPWILLQEWERMLFRLAPVVSAATYTVTSPELSSQTIYGTFILICVLYLFNGTFPFRSPTGIWNLSSLLPTQSLNNLLRLMVLWSLPIKAMCC